MNKIVCANFKKIVNLFFVSYDSYSKIFSYRKKRKKRKNRGMAKICPHTEFDKLAPRI